MTEQWGIFELVFSQPTTVAFGVGKGAYLIDSFWDGDGREVVRFMPPTQGVWEWVTEDGSQQGKLTVGPPSLGNHGPVRVHNTFHFAYADGTPMARRIGKSGRPAMSGTTRAPRSRPRHSRRWETRRSIRSASASSPSTTSTTKTSPISTPSRGRRPRPGT